MYCRDRARKQKALTAVHPAHACKAATAKEPARSQVAELEPWKSRPVARSYVELLRGEGWRAGLGTRLLY